VHKKSDSHAAVLMLRGNMSLVALVAPQSCMLLIHLYLSLYIFTAASIVCCGDFKFAADQLSAAVLAQEMRAVYTQQTTVHNLAQWQKYC
jgi:hypothetical protein